MDKFDAMRIFVRVVESGTFTKAAETLNIQKPTVTRPFTIAPCACWPIWRNWKIR